MSRSLGRRLTTSLLGTLLGTLLGAVLAVGLVAAPAHAEPPSADPELVQRADAHEHGTSSSSRAPAAIDSDVYASANSPTSRIYFVIAGRLKLQLKSGSTTKYKGSLIDYTGNKSYEASADATDATAPKIKLKTKNGTFELVSTSAFGGAYYSATSTKVPSKLKVEGSSVVFGAAAHKTSSRAYAITLTERSGAINDPFEYVGTLTFGYDANGRVSGGSVTVSNSKGKNVTHPLTSSGYSGPGYFYTVAKIDKTYFGLDATVTGSILSGYAFGASGSKTSQWLLSGTTT